MSRVGRANPINSVPKYEDPIPPSEAFAYERVCFMPSKDLRPLLYKIITIFNLQSFTASRSHCSRCCPVVNSIMPNIFMLNQLLLRRCKEKDYSIDLYKISGSLRFLSLLLSRRTPGQACRWSNRRKRKERRNRWRHQRRRLNHLHRTPHFSSIIIVHMTQGQSNTHLWGQFYLAIWDQ